MNDYLYILENNRRINIYASLKYMLQKIFPYIFFIIINFYANFFILYIQIYIFCIFYVNNINE